MPQKTAAEMSAHHHAKSHHHAAKAKAVLPSLNDQSAYDREQIDSRQVFYKLMANKTAAGGKTDELQGVKIKPLKLYRRLAGQFMILVLILALVVGYFSLVKLTIVLTPASEKITGAITIDVYGDNRAFQDPNQSMRGQINIAAVAASGTYQATGLGTTSAAVQVKLINTTNNNQTLVATTRLLTTASQLWRLKSRVQVPARGEILADVYPDTAGLILPAAGDRLTIPGLNAVNQTKIYGLTISGSAEPVQSIQSSDIATAKQNLNDVLITQAKAQLTGNNSGQTFGWLIRLI